MSELTLAAKDYKWVTGGDWLKTKGKVVTTAGSKMGRDAIDAAISFIGD